MASKNVASNLFMYFETPSEDIDCISKYLEQSTKDTKDIKKSIKIEQDYSGMHVVVVAISKDDCDNAPIEIPCTYGKSLSNDVYNVVRDCYVVYGVDFHELGTIPVNYRAKIESVEWEIDIPLPESVIKKYMTSDQKERFEKWQIDYKKQDYDFYYMQVLIT
jgi:hypothetical protein